MLAADQFIIMPDTRAPTTRAARAAGDEPRTVIAGYHWFTDWGRDTMISLEGLTLATGRMREAGYILRTFAQLHPRRPDPEYVPRRRERRAVSHGRRDALVLPRARPLRRRTPSDRQTLRMLLPKLRDIVEHHLRGTRFGIDVDPRDGLLRAGRGGLSAHLDGREGRRLGGDAAARQGGRDQRALVQRAAPARRLAARGRSDDATRDGIARARRRARASSFNERFWYEEGGYLYDVVDGEDGSDDPRCRPNQIFAISLDHPVLDASALGARRRGRATTSC